ncbi:MAG TPA: PilZ domain-containing protein [Terriglobales bacterium]|nr:PilZ domain-containing protein [Terriglobales bacterium]
MIKEMSPNYRGEEKRRFERVEIASAQVEVFDSKGRQAGIVRQLARGGFSMQPQKPYKSGDIEIYDFTIHDSEEDIRAEVQARVRFADEELAGFEFVDLNAEAAVDIGILIGKYYEHSKR